MKWNKTELDKSRVKHLAGKTGMNIFQASILCRRGIRLEESLYFLEDDLRYLHNPFLFSRMSDVVDRIHSAAEEEEKVLIFGDRDVDGISSTVLLYEALKKEGIQAEWKVPTGEAPFGLNPDVIRDFAARDGSLIFCVDCGTSDVAEAALARELGMDLIILDHHNPQSGVLPEAFAIINPKIEKEAYPFEGLAGCGVVSKVIWALCFARTEFYQQDCCFLYLDEAAESLNLYKYLNFKEIGRRSFPVNKILPLEDLAEYLKGCFLLGYGLPGELDKLKSLFGPSAELCIQNLADEVCRDFPSLKGIPFFRLAGKSRLARYCEGPLDKGKAFLNLFKSLVASRYREEFKPFEDSLDLAALGTIADLMPLRNENRIVVKRGLLLLSKALRPGLRELCLRQKILGKNLETRDVSWSIAPLINSSGRMGQADKAVELLLTEDDRRRSVLADILFDLNQKRRSLGDSLWDGAVKEAEKSLETFHGKITLVRQAGIPRGITGIVASRMVGVFSVPSIILAYQKDGSLSGSIRSPRGCSIQPLLDAHRNYFIDFGGHDCAGGFSLEACKEDGFLDSLLQYCREWEPEIREDIPCVDAEIPQGYLKPELWDLLRVLEPFGQGFPKPLFFSPGLWIEKTEAVGREAQNHLKFTLAAGENRFPALYWNGMETFETYMKADNAVNLLYHLSRNYYMNRENLQITVVDMEPALEVESE